MPHFRHHEVNTSLKLPNMTHPVDVYFHHRSFLKVLMSKVLGQHVNLHRALKANLYLPSMPPIRNSIYQESPVYDDYDILQLFQELL